MIRDFLKHVSAQQKSTTGRILLNISITVLFVYVKQDKLLVLFD